MHSLGELPRVSYFCKTESTRTCRYTQGYLYTACFQHIVMCIHIARQRVSKHIPAGVNARNNTTSIARQHISKHASLKTEAVFCVVRANWL
jgi:hypothetical protein